MKRPVLSLAVLVWLTATQGFGATNEPTNAQRQVSFDTNAGVWRVVGTQHRLEFDPTNLACRVSTPNTVWRMAASRAGDLQVRHEGQSASLQLAGAGRKGVRTEWRLVKGMFRWFL